MTKINQEEYETLKELDDKWKWIARDDSKSLFIFVEKPYKKNGMKYWDVSNYTAELIGSIKSDLFQFIQWEDESPYNIAELIEAYERGSHIKQVLEFYEQGFRNVNVREAFIKLSKAFSDESEETEVKCIENVIEFIESDINLIEEKLPKMNREKSEGRKEWHEGYLTAMKEVQNKLGQLDEPEPKNITLQDITHRLWELPLNNRKYWLEQLKDEFQEGYIVPLGLKTTDGEEQYLTYNGSYFASRRNKYLQQTFDKPEEIPEFYRDLAERVL